MPAGDPVQDSVEVPEPPVMPVGFNVHERLVELVVTARVTVPVKPFSGVIEIVEVPNIPALPVRPVGLAVTVKLGALVTW